MCYLDRDSICCEPLLQLGAQKGTRPRQRQLSELGQTLRGRKTQTERNTRVRKAFVDKIPVFNITGGRPCCDQSLDHARLRKLRIECSQAPPG